MILIVKSPIALLGSAGLVAALLSGCGQTGPLYLPNPPARPVPAAVAEQPPQPVLSNNASVPAPTK
ncbi:lipoprotein [Massilia sp. H6]|uniref:LPS translocon maturation chaperone LptM n=1 Tax=Massilia sp. H6 TaxID=2970464 RepID=UPI0035A34145